jgi:hypothetical protein
LSNDAGLAGGSGEDDGEDVDDAGVEICFDYRGEDRGCVDES